MIYLVCLCLGRSNSSSILYRISIRLLSDTLDAVKQSAALCLLRLYRTSAESLQLNTEWTARIIHLLNDQHLVREKISI